jgi:hypothetical protein
MTYEYSFDDTCIGNYRWRKDDYILIQDSFSLLLNEIQSWNVKALEHGATKTPYEQEEDCIEEMIAYGEAKLANQCRYIEIHGISVGSLRYIKAALFLAIRREEERLAQKIEDRWPDGVISSLRERKTALKNIADKITQEPSDILCEFIPKEKTDEIHVSSKDGNTSMEWDVFICHASEDKEEFVRPLAISLISRDLKVWYDELTLTLGDSLRRSIDRGLAHSRYGIVVISPNFLRKDWPQKELDGLAALEVNGRKVILPVWHQIDVSGVREYSPILADRVATSSQKGIEQVTIDISKAIERPLTKGKGVSLTHKFPDEHHLHNFVSASEKKFKKVQNMMPELITQFKTDLSTEDNKLIREFFVLPNNRVCLGGSEKPRLIYYEEEHKGLRNKIDILENQGFLIDVTPGNAPIYRMTEEFVELIKKFG